MVQKTFNYESRGVRYNNCYFDVGEYKDGSKEISIYGNVEDDNNISHISNMTINVKENLKETEAVVDNISNTNLISFLLELGIIKNISRRIMVNGIKFPVAELDLNVLEEYSYIYQEEELRYAS